MSALQKKLVSAPVLTVVSPPCPSLANEPVSIETLAEKIKRLQAEARSLAREQVNALEAKLEEAAALANDIAVGGDAYPVGARELARKFAEDTPRTIQSLEAILHRA
jgi:hypothetical protein